jgi:serine phosphatase RsbU (regulator of sigma subunit)
MTSVAGDFYDFIVPDEKHIGVLVADVSGHGMPAALIASMLKIAFAAQASHVAHPEEVLQGLNRALCGKFQHHYVTAAYAYFDLEKRTLTYAGAGHPPLLVWGPTREGIRDVTENGLFLGMFEFATYTSVALDLAPDDWVLLYTDGIPETVNPTDVQFGDERFRQLLASTPCDSANGFAEQLLAEVSRWSARGAEEDLDDDITLVAIHVQPTS